MSERNEEMKKARRPIQTEDMFFDYYWEQFSEPNDKPIITAIINDDGFTVNPNRTEESKEELKRMKKLHKWLGRAIEFLEGTI